MKNRKARLLALVTSVVAVGALATPANAQTPMTYEVLTGAEIPGTRGFDFHMFPSELTAHPGDTLHFDWGSVILLPAGETEMPFTHFWAADPDDNGFKIDGNAFFPTESGAGCGLTSDNPCVFDGTSVLYPGDQDYSEAGFWVQIADSLDNTTFSVSNLYHELTVTVDSTATQSPAEDPNFDEHIAAATAEAEALLEQLNQVEFETTATGKRVYKAYMGYDNDHISFFEAFPQNLRIRKGDKVEWTMETVVEPHTASTPPAKAKKFANQAFSGAPSCDPDGDQGPGPDGPPTNQETICDDPTQAELDLPNKFAKTQGDGKYPTGGDRAADYETSGLRGGPAGIPRDPYALKFIRKSGDTPFTVMCAIHWNMKTKVTVR